MKFQATVTFEFQATSLEDAGHRLQDAVEHAQETDGMEAKAIELRTPPSGPPVSIPVSAGAMSWPGPQAGNSG